MKIHIIISKKNMMHLYHLAKYKFKNEIKKSLIPYDIETRN